MSCTHDFAETPKTVFVHVLPPKAGELCPQIANQPGHMQRLLEGSRCDSRNCLTCNPRVEMPKKAAHGYYNPYTNHCHNCLDQHGCVVEAVEDSIYCAPCLATSKEQAAQTPEHGLPQLDLEQLRDAVWEEDIHGTEEYEATLRELREALRAWHQQEQAIEAAVASAVGADKTLDHMRMRTLYSAQDAILMRLSPQARELLADVGEFHIGAGAVVAWSEHPHLSVGGCLVSRQVFDLSLAHCVS